MSPEIVAHGECCRSRRSLQERGEHARGETRVDQIRESVQRVLERGRLGAKERADHPGALE